MAKGDIFVSSGVGVSVGSDFIVTAAASETGAIEVNTVSTTGGADVFEERDTTGDGTFDVSFLVESQDGAFHSQKNKLQADESFNQRIRVKNTVDSSIDVQVTGTEVFSRG